MNKKVKVRRIGRDDWSRDLYQSLKTGIVYIDVDGYLHTRTEEGEPDYPIGKLDVNFEVVNPQDVPNAGG